MSTEALPRLFEVKYLKSRRKLETARVSRAQLRRRTPDVWVSTEVCLAMRKEQNGMLQWEMYIAEAAIHGVTCSPAGTYLLKYLR